MFNFPKHRRREDDGQDEDDWEDEDDDGQDDDNWENEDEPHEDASPLQRDLERLSDHFDLWLDNDDRFVIIQSVRLPPGYNYDETDLFLDIPADYPLSPPGIGDNRVYISPHLRFRDRALVDLHPATTPRYDVLGFGPWAWLCYEAIKWDFFTDDLVKFVEMVRADLTFPSTR